MVIAQAGAAAVIVTGGGVVGVTGVDATGTAGADGAGAADDGAGVCAFPPGAPTTAVGGEVEGAGPVVVVVVVGADGAEVPRVSA